MQMRLEISLLAWYGILLQSIRNTICLAGYLTRTFNSHVILENMAEKHSSLTDVLKPTQKNS